jgi:hypothetical protein
MRKYGKVSFWPAPCKGGAFQWVQNPPGNRSSRKQSERLHWRPPRSPEFSRLDPEIDGINRRNYRTSFNYRERLDVPCCFRFSNAGPAAGSNKLHGWRPALEAFKERNRGRCEGVARRSACQPALDVDILYNLNVMARRLPMGKELRRRL